MAIKGKGRTRTRQPVRAPRRAPVPVPVPFARRRGVQALAAFVAGLLVFMGGVWLTNGLRSQERSDRTQREELLKRRAGAAWQTLVETEVGKLGQVELGTPPAILPQIRSTISSLAERTQEDAVGTLRSAASDAKQVRDAVAGYDLANSLREKGFDRGEVLRFLSARDELLAALDLYREAATLAVATARLDVGDRATLLDRAQAVVSMAESAVVRFQTHHLEALSAAGIQPQQPGLPGLPGA
jgi:hypothetical protein